MFSEEASVEGQRSCHQSPALCVALDVWWHGTLRSLIHPVYILASQALYLCDHTEIQVIHIQAPKGMAL